MQLSPVRYFLLFMQVYHRLGENEKLGLSGRPNRPIGALGTSRVSLVLILGWILIPVLIQSVIYQNRGTFS